MLFRSSYFGEPDRFGGRLKVDLGAFNLRRDDGTETRRANIAVEWSRRFVGALGDLWKIAIHGDAATYSAARFGEQPNFAPVNSVSRTQALPQISLGARWPFYRDSGEWGSQLIEPMVEIVAAPRMGDSQVRKIPNEDSFDFEFSDQNLFGFNRFPGIDRLEGGTRLNAALHGAWYLGGTAFDGLVGQSYRTFKDSLFPAASGLHDQVSDVVLRGTFSTSPLVDITYRT